MYKILVLLFSIISLQLQAASVKKSESNKRSVAQVRPSYFEFNEKQIFNNFSEIIKDFNWRLNELEKSKQVCLKSMNETQCCEGSVRDVINLINNKKDMDLIGFYNKIREINLEKTEDYKFSSEKNLFLTVLSTVADEVSSICSYSYAPSPNKTGNIQQKMTLSDRENFIKKIKLQIEKSLKENKDPQFEDEDGNLKQQKVETSFQQTIADQAYKIFELFAD